MKKIISLLCMASLLLCSMSSISVQAVEIEEPCTEIVEEHHEGLILTCSLGASNYNGSLCVNSSVIAPTKMEEIGVKDLIVEYSYNGTDWHYEWNAGNFLSYDSTSHALSNYIIALEHSGCYYHVKCTHYAKKGFLNTQSDSHTSSSVWIPKK